MGQVVQSTDELPHKAQPTGRWDIPIFSFACRPGSEGSHSFPNLAEAFPATPPSIRSDKPSLLGRFRPAICDIAMFRSWLRMCATGHIECSKRPDRGYTVLRLIDVVDMRLITLDDEQRKDTNIWP
jgi:hypothetical protein